MKNFLAVFNAFPAILQTVQAVEGAIPMSKTGQHKMNLVLGAAGTAWEVGQVGTQMTKTNWLSAVESMATLAVAGLNAAGVFGGSTAATAPGSSSPV